MASDQGLSSKNEDKIRQMVRKAKKNRINRVYWEHDFKPANLKKLGIIRSRSKAHFDEVALAHNESIRYQGFDTSGSYFELDLKISNLYDNVQTPHNESIWRLGQVRLILIDEKDKCKYSYEHQQLLEYKDAKRKMTLLYIGKEYDANNIYRIGSLTLEIVCPFALTRIQFNGILMREKLSAEPNDTTPKELEQVSAKLVLSTHPTTDKFDYKYRFSSKHLTEVIQKSTSDVKDATRLLDLALEDKIDQTVMFRCSLELLGTNVSNQFTMWGLRSKLFINPEDELAQNSIDQPTEGLTIWSEFGHVIHIRRPVGYPSLVYGLVHCDLGFASHIYGASCLVPNGVIETDLGRLATLSNLAPGVIITLKVFETKEIRIELTEGIDNANSLIKRPFKVKVNDFDGFGQFCSDNPNAQLKSAQSRLWTINIHDSIFGYKLASEILLGGKGNSLIEMSKLTNKEMSHFAASSAMDPQKALGCVEVSVPRGLVVSSAAYKLWLDSNPLIASSIRELDLTRRSLSAKSYYLNPFSDKYLNLLQHQQTLRSQCQKTSLVLNSCPLPLALKKQLYTELSAIFGESELREPVDEDLDAANRDKPKGKEVTQKKFAVRSSAMGEDSADTSAAGQMKTILDARGFESICRAIVACWSSQFDIEAVTYKTQNGLLFNWPMAVVVQELIQCDSAGVAATCNPMSGDLSQLEITANLGLGEGVVAGKQTDTIRVNLNQISWDSEKETYVGQLVTGADNIEKLVGGQKDADTNQCCLTDNQIIALGNLLLWIKNRSDIKQREVEWGITYVNDGKTGTCRGDGDDRSTSSYCSTISSVSQLQSTENLGKTHKNKQFRLHLLQSRPLTNLNRLTNSEIYHEIDSGLSGPHEVISRANIAEVMSGSLSPLSLTYFLHFCRTVKPDTIICKNMTSEPYGCSAFAHTARAVTLVLTNYETMAKFRMTVETARQQSESMIGFDANKVFQEDIYAKIIPEKNHPMIHIPRPNLLKMLVYDSGLSKTNAIVYRNKINKDFLEAKLPTVSELLDELDNLSINNNRKPSTKPVADFEDDLRKNSTGLYVRNRYYDTDDQFNAKLNTSIKLLYHRLVHEMHHMARVWEHHIRCTTISMAFNKICVDLILSQPHYKTADQSTSNEALNDFSVLIRANNTSKTESGNISSLLDGLIDHLHREGQLKQAQRMSCKELYEHLSSETNTNESAVKYRKFMEKNGHRGNKEFDFSHPTWFDDPSLIIKSLETRLKLNKSSDKKEPKNEEQAEKDKQEFDNIISRIEQGKSILLHYLLPRSRNATIRREESKSMMIKTIDKYRKAFRLLGAYLCLDGKLPDATLVNFLTIDELDKVVSLEDHYRAELGRYIYKARRRQQTAKLGDNLILPRPTMKLIEVNKILDDILNDRPQNETTHEIDTDNVGDHMVKGMTSCGGLVTGRALVVRNIDEMDSLQPSDILITHSIDISWSVYFFTISGIVTEVGGIVSHGAVVAREYGIPTLCTAIGACSKFKTGQMVTLDASRGVLFLADQEKKVEKD